MFKNVIKLHIHFMFMCYMFRPRRAIFRQYVIKESTTLCTLSIVLLKYVVFIINFGVTGYLFFLTFVLRPLSSMYNTC
jgi:fumarate reductase subunit C